MSKIEVDAITEQSGSTLTTGGGAGKTVVVDATTVTLGRCGGTVALASGASQTGFGRTGTVDWQTTPKTATFTAVSGEGYFANTTGSAFNMNLPAGVAGAIVSVADYAATFQTNALTVVPNGTDKIGSLNENATLSTQGQSVTFVFVDSTQGWINTMDSTSNVRGTAPFIVATSPCVATVGDYKIHTFTGPGTFTVTNAGSPGGSNTVDYLVLAGGGGGGEANPKPHGAQGGGGAGGFRESVPSPAAWSGSPLANPANARPVSVQAYPITVGGGGAVRVNGVNSIFSDITSTGGGAGGFGPGAPTSVGSPGGSGGGGNYNSSGPNGGGSGNTPPVSPPQGNNGGGANTNNGAGAGGGGATSAAGNISGPCSTAGGNGATSSFNNTPTVRAGGGGGGNDTPGAQGSGGPGGGGGGGSPNTSSSAGTANTGGGGGGSGTGGGTGSCGSAGGSGIVILRYKFQ